MGGIKYYRLAKGEELPDEFCAVRDVDGEPSEYMFYVPEAENAKLRELLLRELLRQAIYARDDADWASIVSAAIALGVEVDG